MDSIIPGSGPAQIGYIFGYLTKGLIQVNLLWGQSVDPDVTPASVVATANILRNYFVRQGFSQDRMVLNLRLADDSIIVFRGTDDEGRMALLHLIGIRKVVGEGGEAEMKKFALKLSYIEDTVGPDIFRVEPGEF